jgi:type IV pilus assembly protein PilY1
MLKRLVSIAVAAHLLAAAGLFSILTGPGAAKAATSADYKATPPFVAAGVPPLVMLVMGRNHKLYYEAYNDASDLNNDDILDVGYNPDIEYYGYFDSYKCYTFNSSTNRFEPSSETVDKTVNAANEWSGDFLNYLAMSRMDCLRKVLYGGYRSTDTASATVLERAYIPQDGHCWGKEYYSINHDGYDIRDYTPLDLPIGASRHLFVNTTLDANGDGDASNDPPLLRVLENSVYRIWQWIAKERPVAGGRVQLADGSTRAVTDNNVPGTLFDVTDGGSAGTTWDSYSSSPYLIDHFNDNTIGSDWTWADHDDDSATAHSETGGELIIEANGHDVWKDADEFASLYRDNVSGNFDFWVRVVSQEHTHDWAKCGIMVRNDMTQADASTGYCMMSVTAPNIDNPSLGDDTFSFQWDADADGRLDHSESTGDDQEFSPPDTWVRLTKEDDTFSGYYWDTTIGSWKQVRQETIPSANVTQDLGLFVTSHSDGEICTVHFDTAVLYHNIEPMPEHAFDDNTSTEWRYPDEPAAGSNPWILFHFSDDKEVKSYTINGGADAPDSWELQGSEDGSAWDVLDTVSGAGLVDGTTETFECDTYDLYDYYRLVVTDTSDPSDSGFSIREIEMMEATEPIPSNATLTDYEVRVEVCDPSVGLEANSKLYPSGVYKPVGILQRHGESDRMYFGLLTGSYTNNTSGGVLRKNIGTITDEINANTGEFLYFDDASVEGIIKTIDSFRIEGFCSPGTGSSSYCENCGWITGGPISEGECRMWGNPVAEMMYESLRYYAGLSPTSEFTYGTGGSLDDNELDLPKPDWISPYLEEDTNGNGLLDAGEDTNGNGKLDGFDYCAKPFMLVLSDIYPTYDSDQLPGSPHGSVSSTLSGLNVQTLAQTISSEEGILGSHFIGEAGSYDGACTPKSVSGFGNIRGLCPEEPTKEGSYYSASVAYHGNTVDVNSSANADQKVGSYCVGLASPLPKIDMQVGDRAIRLVPFGKSVGGFGISSAEGDFQPTNTIVDFFVDEITPTYGKFRINFEDVEQGADHDMDAIVEYEYQVLDASDNPVDDPAAGVKVRVTLNSTYAAGGIIQHMGYVVSGSTQDGTYLDVRDFDTGEGSDPDYFLDTPPGEVPGGNWNDGAHLPLQSTRIFTPGDTAAGLLKNPLWYAAKWGGFEDYNGDGTPDQQDEWDNDGDGSPDTYFYVQNPLKLEEQLNQSFEKILGETSAGTAASVISQTRSGEGAVYQAVFFPEYEENVKWVGDVRALWVDTHGNMREDTLENRVLDPADDRIVIFTGNSVEKYEDANGNYIPEPGELVATVPDIDDVEFLWSASEWLNEMSDSEAVSQRVNYADATMNRYIFTFVDQNSNQVCDSGEQVPFVYPSVPPSDLTDLSTIFPYMNLFPTFGDEPSITHGGSVISLDAFRAETTAFADFLNNQSRRVVNFIRGEDQPQFVSGTSPSYILPPFRSRQVDYDGDGDDETWRLGDVVYSTPTAVSRPAEGYHLLYRDDSYGKFVSEFQSRRNVVYVGANDGMFHAFNAGFYDPAADRFNLTPDGTGEASAMPLGAELWAYVPYNLLPHLYWLTETEYPHVYYCDLKPKVFDAKILPDDTHYTDADSEPNWGTFVIGGMRMGGGEIIADRDKTDGPTPEQDGTAPDDRTMRSAYFILDITDPESPPEVIAEFSFNGLGYTTCYPAVIPMRDKDGQSFLENEWYLLFGSGPAEASGSPGIYDSLEQAVSEQEGKVFMLDLKELSLNGNLQVLDSSGSFAAPDGTDYYQSLDADSFISDPVSVDYNLDFNADVAYFGTVQDDGAFGATAGGWRGKLRRVVFDNEPTNTGAWVGDSTLIDLTSIGQPITAAPSAAIGNRGKRYVYFGTGRFLVNPDKEDLDQQTYYGIVEPFNDANSDNFMQPAESLTWATVDRGDLVDVSYAEVYDDRSVSNVSFAGNSPATWEDLIALMDGSTTAGWYIDFHESPTVILDAAAERNLGQGTLLGELLTYTTYMPSTDKCTSAGESNLYAVYYKTGTPYFRDVIGSSDAGAGLQSMDKVASLGRGLAVSPNIHVGGEEGSKAFVQTSTGEIKVVQEINPAQAKSGIRSWREMQ